MMRGGGFGRSDVTNMGEVGDSGKGLLFAFDTTWQQVHLPPERQLQGFSRSVTVDHTGISTDWSETRIERESRTPGFQSFRFRVARRLLCFQDIDQAVRQHFCSWSLVCCRCIRVSVHGSLR